MKRDEPMTPEIGRSPEPRAREAGAAEGHVVVVFQPRSILTALGVLLAVIAAVEFMLLAEAGLTLVVIALFLALALNPAVEFVERRGVPRGAPPRARFAPGPAVPPPPRVVVLPPPPDHD